MKEKSALPEVARIIGVGGCLLISPQYSTGIKLKKNTNIFHFQVQHICNQLCWAYYAL